MKYIVRAKDVLRTLAAGRYLQELAYKALDNPANGKYLVDTEREKMIVEGNYRGSGDASDDKDAPRPVKVGGPKPCH